MKDFIHFEAEDGFVGDPLPLYHDGVYHIYYNKIYKSEKLDKPQDKDICVGWGHISTKDWIHFTEHPDAFKNWIRWCDISSLTIPVNSGCVFFGEGKFHAYFAGVDEEGNGLIRHAVSDDGIAFGESEVAFSHPGKWYEDKPGYPFGWRDPIVAYDEEKELYHMLFQASIKDTPENREIACYPSVIGHAVSKDLYRWTCLEPLSLQGAGATLECPDLFRDGDKWILGYYWQDTRFRWSYTMDGPWNRCAVMSPDHYGLQAARQMYDGKDRYLLGWIPNKECYCSEENKHMHLAFPRILRIAEDGTPQTMFAPALWKLFSTPVPLDKWRCQRSANAMWTQTDGGWAFDVSEGGSIVYHPNIPEKYAMRFTLTMNSPYGLVNLILGAHHKDGTGLTDTGYMIIWDSAAQMLRLRHQYLWDQTIDIMAIHYNFQPGVPVDMEILVHNGILEVSIDHTQTMIGRMPDYVPGGIAFQVQDVKGTIQNLQVFDRNKDLEN